MSTAIFGSTEPSIADKFRAQEVLLAEHPQILRTRHRILLGDARIMSNLPNAEIHLVVTSPPYWILKRYQEGAGTAQLGHVQNYDQFLKQLNLTWKRCYDALVPGGRLCIVVGDVCLPRKKIGRHLVVPLHADISLACRSIGFDYLTPILWYKIANAATEVEGNGAPFLGKPYEPNAIIKNDVEYILIFRKPGGYRKPTADQRLLSLIPKEEHSRWFRAIWDDIPGSSRTKGHPAPFPVEVAYRLIHMFSFVGDTVLDPFLGTGTTTEAAMSARRSSIGYEIEESYYNLVKARLSQIEFETEVSFENETSNTHDPCTRS